MSDPVPAVHVEASDAAVALILACEIGSEALYEARYTRPTWPGGASGPTIGVGYDCGYATASQITRDWLPHLPASDVERLAACAGIKGIPAGTAAAGLHAVSVPWAAAEAVFRQQDVARYSDLTRHTFRNCDSLPADSFGALVSVVFNRGASLAEGPAPDPRREMRAIWALMSAGHFELIPAQLRSMKRLWLDTGLGGLVARREAEAKLFEQGLAAMAAPIAAHPAAPTTDDLNATELARVTGGTG